MFFKPSALAATLCAVVPSLSSAYCYTVYGPQDRIAYQSTVSPVDLSLQLHDALRARFPGHQLVFEPDSERCVELGAALTRNVAQAPAGRFALSASTRPVANLDAVPLFQNADSPRSTSSMSDGGVTSSPAYRANSPAARRR